MRLSRLVTLSVIYNLRDYLHNRSFTTDESLTVSGFPYIHVQSKDQAYTTLTVPSIVVYPSSLFDSELQIGGGFWMKSMFNMDIYANSDAQVLEIADMIMEFIESPTYLFRYDLTTPTYQVSDGLVRPMYSNGSPIPVSQMYFENRTVVYFDRVTTIGEKKAHTAQVTAVVSVPTT
jgi:hypothetical protein